MAAQPADVRRRQRVLATTITATLLAVLLIAAVLTGPLATAARADDESVGEITRMDVTADIEPPAGTSRVALDFDYDFADEEAHGPFLVLAERQEIAGDSDHYRRMEISDITAESLGGAPGDLRVNRDDGTVELYVGDADVDVTGLQSYRVTYAIDGLINPSVTGPAGVEHDELYWNVVSPGGFDIELQDVSVTVTGPVATEATACYTGRSDSDQPCDASARPGSTANEFRQSRLAEREGLSVALGWPVGTFPDAEPRYEPRRTLANTLQLTPLTGGITGLLALLGAGVAIVIATRRGRDEAYLGTTPGLAPADGAAGRIGRVERRPIAVRFTPPDGVRPGAVGTLHNEVAGDEDVSATLIDLAVRGYLRIEEIDPEEEGEPVRDWRLVPLRGWPEDELRGYESELLDRVFDTDADEGDSGGPALPSSVALSDVAERYALAVSKTQTALYETVTRRGWFRTNPRTVRRRWVALAALIFFTSMLVLIGLWLLHWPVIFAVAPLIVALVVLVMAGTVPARTASGTAVLAQTLGFKQYLATAEADQIRFEEGQDLFSRYLPYAMIFGLTDRWVQIFADLVAEGRQPAEPTWYVPVSAGPVWWLGPGGFEESIGALTGAATDAVTGASVGAGGGSGFAGSVGGGVGGMGGGSW